MGGIAQVLIFGISLTIANGLPHLNRHRRPIYNGLYSLPDFCANQYRNLEQAFLCHYYYGLRNAPQYNNYGYRQIPDLYDRYKDGGSDFTSREDVPTNTDNENLERLNNSEEVSIKPDSEFPRKIMYNDAVEDLNKDHDKISDPSNNDLIDAELHAKGSNQNGEDSENNGEKDIVGPPSEGKINQDKISNIVFPDDIDEIKTFERMKMKFDEKGVQDVHRPIDKEQKYSDLAYPPNIYLIPNNQPVKPINNAVFPLPTGGINSNAQITLPNNNILGNRFNPVYVSNSAFPGQENTYDQNLNTKQPTYHEVPLNNVPIILIPKDGQTIVSNTRQIIVIGNGQNIPNLVPNQIFILNNGQYLPSSDDETLPSGNGIPQVTVQEVVPDSNQNMLKSNNQNIVQDNNNNTPKPSLPLSNDIISQIFNQDLPKTNEPLPITPKEVEQDPITLPAIQNIPQETGNLPQNGEEHLPLDNLPNDPQNNGQALPLPLDNGPREDNPNIPPGNGQLFESDKSSNVAQNNGDINKPDDGKNVSQEFPYAY